MKKSIRFVAILLLSYSSFSLSAHNTLTPNSVALQLTLDDYPEETTWQIADLGGTVLYSGGPYANPAQIGETIIANFTLDDECYIFTINDSANDGICCQFGNGSYAILDEDNNTLAAGGEFADTDIKTICINTSNIDIVGEWKTLKTGAGGWLTGMDIHPSGNPVFTRSDVGGAYRFDPATKDWTQVVTTASMPINDVYWATYSGVLSIVSAPSDNSKAYMAYYRGIYKSSDMGDNWTHTNFPNITINANADDSKLGGERLAVDPNNEDVVYFGSVENGLYYTDNGGSNWNIISSVPAGASNRGIRDVKFDPTSGTIGSKTKTIYVTIDGIGIYQSRDAGQSWTNISPGSYWPNNDPYFYDVEVDTNNGYLYICGEDYDDKNTADTNDDETNSFGILQFDGNAWSQIFNDQRTMGEIAIDPFDTNRLFIFSYGFTDVYRTTNGLSNNPNWTFLNYDIEAGNIPWLEWLESDYFSLGEIVFDPVDPDKIWIAHGTGSYVATDINGTSFIWDEESKGQEHLVSNDIVSFSNRNVLTAHWDFPMFLHSDLDEYPEVMKPTNRFNAAWDIDQSPTDENFLVAIVEDERFCCFGDGQARSSSYSEDGGETWTRFPNMPGGTNELMFGLISVSANDNNNWVWLAGDQRMPYVTMDKGNSWTQVTLPGASSSCCLDAYYFKRRALTADRVLPNTFYIYDWGDGSIFKSIDGGLSWTKSAPNVVKDFGYNAKLLSVPSKAGHLLFVSGAEDAKNAIRGLSLSEDGGLSWTEFTDTDEVLNVAVGKQSASGNYPTIFINGKVNGDYGFYKSEDKGLTWNKLPTYPLGYYDIPTVMEADMNLEGRLYVGYPGNGFVYFNESGIENQAAHLLLGNNSLELIPNADDSYFMLEGSMENYEIDLLDANENIIESYDSQLDKISISIGDLNNTPSLLRVRHKAIDKLLLQTKLN